MTTPATHRALDHHFAIAGNTQGLELLRALLGSFEVDDGVPAQQHYSLEIADGVGRLRIGDGDVIERADGDAASYIMTAVNREAMLSVRDVDVVHAAVVALGDSTILIPAHSGAGKSTLSAALTAAGFTYLSDELAPIRDDLTVDAFPKPIVVGVDSMGVLAGLASADIGRGHLGRWFLDPALLSGGRATLGDRRPVTHVLMPRFAAGSPLALNEPSPGRVAADLFVNSFNLGVRGRPGLERLARLATRVARVEVHHGNANEVASELSRRLSV